MNFLIWLCLRLSPHHIPSTQQWAELSHRSGVFREGGMGTQMATGIQEDPQRRARMCVPNWRSISKGRGEPTFLRSHCDSSFAPMLFQLPMALALCSNNLPDLMTTFYKINGYLCCKGDGTEKVPCKSPHLQKASCSTSVYWAATSHRALF